MARQLTPLGRLLLVVCGLALVGYGLYRYGAFQKLAAIGAPEKKPEGSVSKDDFGAATAPIDLLDEKFPSSLQKEIGGRS